MSTSYRNYLKELYQSRKTKNKAYSLVAFSRDAGFKSYHMYDILSGRYGLSPKRALSVAQNLKLSRMQIEEFMALVEAEYSRSDIEREIAQNRLKEIKLSSEHTICEQDLSSPDDWFYISTLLELSRQSAKPLTITRICRELGWDLIEALKGIEVFKAFMSKNTTNQKMLSLQNKPAKKSEPIRRYHKKMLSIATKAIEDIPTEKRFFSSFNVNLTQEEYTNLTTEIAAFIRKKVAQVSNNEAADEDIKRHLHAINLQIIPLQKD